VDGWVLAGEGWLLVAGALSKFLVMRVHAARSNLISRQYQLVEGAL
jgi:hypothetical protein